MTYCPSIIQSLKVIWISCIRLSFISKRRLRATLQPTFCTFMFLTLRLLVDGNIWLCIFRCKGNDDSSCHITNHSWVALFHLRLPRLWYYFFLTSQTICHDLLPLYIYNVLALERCPYYICKVSYMPAEEAYSPGDWSVLGFPCFPRLESVSKRKQGPEHCISDCYSGPLQPLDLRSRKGGA